MLRRLPVYHAHHDQPMELFQRPTTIAEFDGQPVEQLGMRRFAAHFAEVIGCIYETSAEVVMPDAVDDGAPRQRVVRIGQPAGQGRAAAPLVLRIVELELRRQRTDTS